MRSGYQSYQDGELTWEQWHDSVNRNFQRERKKDLARLFGVEPEDLSEADDAPTKQMLLDFARELACSQSSVEWAEFAGAGVFEIVLAALLALFTAGAGNAAQAASQLRHASRLRGLDHLFRKLARLLRRKKLNKTVDAPVDEKQPLKRISRCP